MPIPTSTAYSMSEMAVHSGSWQKSAMEKNLGAYLAIVLISFGWSLGKDIAAQCYKVTID